MHRGFVLAVPVFRSNLWPFAAWHPSCLSFSPFFFTVPVPVEFNKYIQYPLFNQVKNSLRFKTSFPRVTWPRRQHKSRAATPNTQETQIKYGHTHSRKTRVGLHDYTLKNKTMKSKVKNKINVNGIVHVTNKTSWNLSQKKQKIVFFST